MTFTPNNRGNDFSKPLVQDNIEQRLARLDNDYLDLFRTIENVKQTTSKVEKMPVNEYRSIRKDLKEQIQDIPNSLANIMKQIDNLNSTNPPAKMKQKIADKVKIINSKIQAIRNDLISINKTIDNKEKYLFDLMRSQTIRDSNPQERKSSAPKSEDDIFFSQLEVIELKTNEEELNRRQKDLEDINKISGQIKDLSNQINVQVHEDGKKLDDIEANIVMSKENAEGAEEQIILADKDSRSMNKKLIFLFLFLLVLIIVIVVLVIVYFA